MSGDTTMRATVQLPSQLPPQQPEQQQEQQQQQQQQIQQQQQQQPMTARNQPETARTARSVSRATLHPSVQDFNGNIINKAMDDEQVVWTVGKSHAKILPSSLGSDMPYAFPVPATFRGTMTPTALDLSTSHHVGRLPQSLSLNRHDRTAAWTEEVHRRHVARTAHVRQCLSPKQRRKDRVVPVATPTTTTPGIAGMTYYDSESTFNFSLPVSNGHGDSHHGHGHFDDVRISTSLSRASSRTDNVGAITARQSRPATTGRYFDTSNGLRNLRSDPAILRTRPTTASPWAGPGLQVKKMVLRQKELITI